MKAGPRAVVEHLRRAEREGDRKLADFLADEVVRHLERLDEIEPDFGRRSTSDQQ